MSAENTKSSISKCDFASSLQSQGCYEGLCLGSVTPFNQRRSHHSTRRVFSWMRHKVVPRRPSGLSWNKLAKHIGQSWVAEEPKSGASSPAARTELADTTWMDACTGRPQRDRSLCGQRPPGSLL